MIVEPFEWKRRVCLNGCLVHDNKEDCSGPLEAHHVITKEALKKRHLEYLNWDVRNGFAACQKAHSRHTGAFRRIPYELIPPAAFEFAREIGLEWQIERYYPRLGDTVNPGSAA